MPDSPVNDPPSEVRRSDRHIKTPSYLKHFHHGKLPTNSATKRQQNTAHAYSLCKYLDYDHLSADHKSYSINLSLLEEPKTYEEAIKHKHWQEAILAELKALEDNNTRSIVTKPPHAKLVGCKFVFKTKFNEN